MNKYGIVLVSHVEELAYGLSRLLSDIAPTISITFAGGIEDGDIGTSYDKVQVAFDNNKGNHLLCFYDLGSAKLTMEMVMESIDKQASIYHSAFVEGAFTAATLCGADLPIEDIEDQLKTIIVK